jgi:hypothetical protein
MHWHGGEVAEPPDERTARARGEPMAFPRYAKPFSPRSWLGVLAARYKAMAEEKVCVPLAEAQPEGGDQR